MMIALVHAHFSPSHLAEVIRDMEQMGPPTIHAVDLGDGRFQALEGCHRLRAANLLGLDPELILVDYSDIEIRDIGLDFDGDMTVAELCDDSHLANWLEF